MVFLLLSAGLFFFSFCGLGLMASRFTFLKIRSGNFFLNFFTGFAISGLYFSLIQLFFPLTLWTLLPVLLAGLAGLFLFLPELKEMVRSSFLFFAISLFLFFIISYIISSKSKIDAYDDFLYHASIVSWLNAYKVVPGIANLHFRLGMNSLYLQVAAGLDVGIWDKRSSSITVCLIYFSFIGYCLNGIYAACKKTSAIAVRFAFFQAVMAIWLVLTEAVEPYLNYDNPALVFIALVISEMLIYSFGEKELEDTGSGRSSWETIFLYAAVSFAIKPMGALAVFMVFAAACFWKAKHKAFSFGELVKLSALPLCVLALFVVRNVIQTGYLMFPMTVFKLDFPWTLSKEIVDTNINAIQNYSRTIALGYEYQPGQGFWYWFIPWLKIVLREGNNILLPFVLVAGLVVASLSLFRRQGNGLVKLAYYAFVIANLLFCFITVPELRYDTVWIYSLLALAIFFSPGFCLIVSSFLGRCWRTLCSSASRFLCPAKDKGGFIIAAGGFMLLAILLLLPSVRLFLIWAGSLLARHELDA
ncbi:MAG: hypothetical protein IJU95_06130, partial [Treponema sp.]|nr:hypothetical protein [Treponema sp.]